MKYEEAQRWLERADPSIAKQRESITQQLDGLKEKAADGLLTHDGAAAWYALVGEMRRLADYYERDLIRKSTAETPFHPAEGKPFGYMDSDEWNEFAIFMHESGILKKQPDAAKAHTNELVGGD